MENKNSAWRQKMTEKNIDFDKVIDRRNTDCLKYDFAVKRGKPEHILPLWVADMDFKTSGKILDAIHERVEHGIFGYTGSGGQYFEAVAGWMKKRHGWDIKRNWLVKTPGVVFALAMAVKAYSKEGEAVLIQQPVYYPFTEVIEDNGRTAVSNDLILGEDGHYHIDFVDFERKIMDHHIPLFLLCSPHNPAGRVWTEEELLRIGEICLKHHVTVVSDEIHEDFVFGERKHLVFANLGKEFEEISVICTSPAKTFNLAGLQISNIFIPDGKLRRQFRKQIAAAGYSQLNTIGLTACEAAYRYGDEWYEAMLEYVQGNIRFMKQYLEKELPQLTMTEPEGTYLVWVDFGRLGLSESELEDLIVNKANLWLDSGAIFGKAGEGFERFNVACPRVTLEKALDQLKEAVRSRHYFYGQEKVADIRAVHPIYPGIETPMDLYDALSEIWCADTCAPRMRQEWSIHNTTLGQCSITAFLAQDIFGGEVYGMATDNGGLHCYNVVDGVVFDLTSEQYGRKVKELHYADNPVQDRESAGHFGKEEKRERYEMLKKALEKRKETGNV